MFSLIKQVLTSLSSCNSSLVHERTKCLSLNDKPRMVRPTIIDLNSIELKYYI